VPVEEIPLTAKFKVREPIPESILHLFPKYRDVVAVKNLIRRYYEECMDAKTSL
jgi:hypothetical protein